MKISQILPVAGILTVLACGAAFAQMPMIPPGAGARSHRPPPGSRFPHHHARKHTPAAAHHHKPPRSR